MKNRDIEVVTKLASTFAQTHAFQKEEPFWKALRTNGTELWLDTGDMGLIDALWDQQMTAVTTNNTLLNQEIQKGIYDHATAELHKELGHIADIELRVREIAFYLNALHGLRLANRYRCKVSVELHTDLSHHVDLILDYGMRFHAISPRNFIVKVPFTPSGLIGARLLHEKGVPVNLTLQFSARQNVLTAIVAKPTFTNVFMGRVQAYVENNHLASPANIGEMVIEQTQRQLWALRHKHLSPTRLIAASLRQPDQLVSISGTDVFTIPPTVATKGLHTEQPIAKAALDTSGAPRFTTPRLGEFGELETLWHVPQKLIDAAIAIDANKPDTPKELVKTLCDNGFADIFPLFAPNERQQLANDGKIPIHAHWEKPVAQHEFGVDALLTQAGLASFAADQAQLDNRIRSLA